MSEQPEDTRVFDRSAESEVEMVVANDVTSGLAEQFTPSGPGLQLISGPEWETPITNGDVTVVVWRFTATPTSALIGGNITPEEVEIDGTTHVIGDLDDPTLMRYVDWISAYSKLGLIGAQRVPGSPTTD